MEVPVISRHLRTSPTPLLTPDEPLDEEGVPLVPGLLWVRGALDGVDLLRSSPPVRVERSEDLDGLWVFTSSSGGAAIRLAVLGEVMALPAFGAVVAVPHPGIMLVLPLDDPAALTGIGVLAAAASGLVMGTVDAITDQLVWTDGTRYEHVAVSTDDEGGIIVAPSPGLVAGLVALTSGGLVGVPAVA